MREHWQSGYADTRRTLRRKDWLAMPRHGAELWCTKCTARMITDHAPQ